MEQHQEVSARTSTDRFQVVRLEDRIAPSIVAVNGGGNTPKGDCNGVPRLNPAAHEPSGHNK
jgi:hypothetical protein